MIGKYPVPFVLSGATALVMTCLGISKLHAAEHEAPAILNFATSYLQQQQQQPPKLTTPSSVGKKPDKTVAPLQKHPPVSSRQLDALRKDVVDKNQQIAQKNGEISALEQQIFELKNSAYVPEITHQAPHLSPVDKQAALDFVNTLRQAFSFHPTYNSLATKLAQVKDQLKEVQLAETALRSQLKTINDGKDRIVNTHEDELKQRIEQHNIKISELEAHLASSREDIEKITAERNDLATREQKLTAQSISEKKAFDKEKQQLLDQISQSNPAEGQLAANVKQQQALQQQLSEEQQFKTMLQDDNDRLQAQLAESQLMAKALQIQMDLVQSQQTAAVVTTNDTDPNETSPKSSHQDDNKKIPELQAKLDAALAELATAKKQKNNVKPISNLPDITQEQLNKKSVREGYAIGMSLGDEILQMQEYNSNWGTTIEKNLVLAGIVDAFHGQAKLSTDVLRSTLSDVGKQEKKDQEKRSTGLDESTRKYLKSFTKLKNTKKSPSGFWYNIVYEGDTTIPKTATIDVIVKESLTNGDVITDMDVNGTKLTQPLSDFPDIFREALQKLKNHGSITIVVPPELAYKDKGLPPRIPPNATMIYELRISDMYQ